MIKAVITGATGFVGSALVRRMAAEKNRFSLLAFTRNPKAEFSEGVRIIQTGDLGPDSYYSDALSNVDVVIHTAARVHVMKDTTSEPLVEYRRTNVEGTLNLARHAARSGVKRFIFLSSIKVNGENTAPGKPFTEEVLKPPNDPYGVSKFEAETQLKLLASEVDMQVVIIRPVLVYGPGVKANFHSLMKWLSRGVPLPLGAIHNQRSLLALDNLTDLIITCINHPEAGNQTFLASDGQDISTTELLKMLGNALNTPARLIPIPMKWIETMLRLAGLSNLAQRLCGSLQVDITKAKTLLGWNPPVSIEEGLKKTAKEFVQKRGCSQASSDFIGKTIT
jgi:UDP-4-keto-D-QuiNAc 4-reductase